MGNTKKETDTSLSYPKEIHERFGKFRDASSINWMRNITFSLEDFQNFVMYIELLPGHTYAYYFDQTYVLRRKEVGSLEELKLDSVLKYKPQKDEWFSESRSPQPFFPGYIAGTPVNVVWLSWIAKTLQVGDTFDEYIRRYNERGTYGNKTANNSESLREFYRKYAPEKLDGLSQKLAPADAENRKELERFIQKVCVPVIERETGNQNRDTFDFVRLRMGIPQKECFPKRKRFVKENIREICKIARRKIDQTKNYQKYGVPAKFLKLDRVMITAQSELELLFVLPETVPGEKMAAAEKEEEQRGKGKGNREEGGIV